MINTNKSYLSESEFYAFADNRLNADKYRFCNVIDELQTGKGLNELVIKWLKDTDVRILILDNILTQNELYADLQHFIGAELEADFVIETICPSKVFGNLINVLRLTKTDKQNQAIRACILASEVIDSKYYSQFPGNKANSSQELEWPRIGISTNWNGIPALLKKATFELALFLSDIDITSPADAQNLTIKSETVGESSRTYKDNAGITLTAANGLPVFVTDCLAPLFTQAGNVNASKYRYNVPLGI